MLSKRYSPDNGEEDNVPTPDEGWWAAVLADEDGHLKAQRESGIHTSVQTTQPVVNWDRIRELFDHDEIVDLHVQAYNRGGLLVGGDGIQGFVPVSHLIDMPTGISEAERREIMAGYVGHILSLKVIECEEEQERVVFSERAALAGEGRRKDLFHALKPGECVQGTVTNVTEFGVFVDLGGLEGLIHVSELSWGRVQHPSDVLSVNDEIEALVLHVSEENARVALSLKRLTPNPWDSIPEHYKTGDVVTAVITGIARFGAFARLEEGVEGLIHVSSMKLKPGATDISYLLTSGQTVQVRILHVDAEKRRLGLSLVQSE
jgi:small subunit ribosomal protein S1